MSITLELATAAQVLSDPYAMLVTSPPNGPIESDKAHVPVLYTYTVPPAPPTASCDPSGENCRASTMSEKLIFFTSDPSAVLCTSTSLSFPPDATQAPSGEKSTQYCSSLKSS